MSRLDVLMRAVLARLELASHSPAQNTEGNVSHGKSSGNPPPRVPMPHIHYALLYTRATSDVRRRKVVTEALNELRSIRYAKKGGHRDTKEGRLMVGRDSRPIGTVAYVFGYTKRHVYRLRAEAREHDARRRPIGLYADDNDSQTGRRVA